MSAVLLLLLSAPADAYTATSERVTPQCDDLSKLFTEDCGVETNERKYRARTTGTLYDDGIDGDIKEPPPILVLEEDAGTLILAVADPSGDAAWWTVPMQEFGLVDARAQVAVGDLDGDGTMDLVIADDGHLAIWYDAPTASAKAPHEVELGIVAFDLLTDGVSAKLVGVDVSGADAFVLTW